MDSRWTERLGDERHDQLGRLKFVHTDFQLNLPMVGDSSETFVVITVWGAGWAARALEQLSRLGVEINRICVAVDAGVAEWLKKSTEEFSARRTTPTLRSRLGPQHPEGDRQLENANAVAAEWCAAVGLHYYKSRQVLVELSSNTATAVLETFAAQHRVLFAVDATDDYVPGHASPVRLRLIGESPGQVLQAHTELWADATGIQSPDGLQLSRRTFHEKRWPLWQMGTTCLPPIAA